MMAWDASRPPAAGNARFGSDGLLSTVVVLARLGVEEWV
jgi:hypothetical protein